MSIDMTRRSILVGRAIKGRSETLPSPGGRPIGPPGVPLPPWSCYASAWVRPVFADAKRASPGHQGPFLSSPDPTPVG